MPAIVLIGISMALDYYDYFGITVGLNSINKTLRSGAKILILEVC